MNLEIENLTEALECKIDRSTWKTWIFSDLAENINEKVVPKDSGLEHYIGLGHLDSGSLHIRRFGETESLIGDKLKIYKGDLIFAKRNAYLKRVAIAEFDAVASAHSLVLRAKPENVLPEFLPFFMLSETFWQKAIEISVGSLSPTINWRALTKQEFLLPPKAQQAELAELLWALDKVVEEVQRIDSKLTSLENSLQRLLKQKYFDKAAEVPNEENVVEGRLDSFFQLQRGFDLTQKHASEGAVPVISSSGVSYYHNEAKCDAPGVITGRKGKLGEVYFIDKPHWPHDTSLWVKNFMGNDPKFGLFSFCRAKSICKDNCILIV